MKSDLIKKYETQLKTCPFCGSGATLDIQEMDDDHRFPRPHWHAKVECSGCGITYGWRVVSKQQAEYPEDKMVQRVVDEWNSRKNNI